MIYVFTWKKLNLNTLTHLGVISYWFKKQFLALVNFIKRTMPSFFKKKTSRCILRKNGSSWLLKYPPIECLEYFLHLSSQIVRRLIKNNLQICGIEDMSLKLWDPKRFTHKEQVKGLQKLLNTPNMCPYCTIENNIKFSFPRPVI